MSFAYLALYTGDYFRDTRGLSMAGHGCYFLLLTYCWDAKGPLPLDEERIAGICNARSNEERTTMDKILSTYFTRMDDGWYNRRMQIEIERAHAIGLARKAAGAKGYQARAKQLPGKSKALAKHEHLTPPPPPSSAPGVAFELLQKQPTGRASRASRLSEDWKIPEDWIAIGLAVHPDWARAGVIRESLTFRDHFTSAPGDRGLKTNWLATWRNWIRRAALEHAR